MTTPPLSRITATRAFQAHHVRHLLCEAIAAGEFGHVALPDEQLLAQDYQVSRNVIREALDQLRQEGMVVRLPGSGTFTLPPKSQHRFDELMGLQDTFGERVGYIAVEIRTIRAPQSLSLALDIPRGTEVFHLERVAALHGRPAVLLSTYIPVFLIPELASLDLRRLRRHLTERGLDPATATISMGAVGADPSTAALLDVAPDASLLLVRRVLRLPDATPAEVGYSYYNTAIVEPVIEQRRLGGVS